MEQIIQNTPVAQQQTQGVVNGDNQANSVVAPATDGSIVKQPEQTEDLLSRVSKVKLEETTPKSTDTDGVEFDYSKLNEIKTPEEAKAWAENSYKSFQRGFNSKFQDLAEKRKTYETKLETISKWTPERLQQELNNPEFVKVAQSILGVETQSSESYLSDADKKQLAMVQQQISTLNQQNAQLLKKQEDEKLKAKYANYIPDAVDTLTSDLIAGKVQATREHLHKVLDYEDAIRRAYKLGLQDKKLDMGDKVNSMSMEGGQAVSGYQPPPPKEGENTAQYFKRAFLERVSKTTGGQTK